MNRVLVSLAVELAVLLALPVAGAAQAAQQAGVLTIQGQAEQAPLIRVNGKAYVDVESLARLTHGSVSFQGSQTILTLPGGGSGAGAAAPAAKTPQLSWTFLSAEIEALTQIREWRVALVNAIENNYPVTDKWVGNLRRSADAKLQLAVAAATTDPDQKAAELLRNEFNAMQQTSDGFLAMQTKANYISPDSFSHNPQDEKILSCQRALVSMAETKQFQDEVSCH